MFHSSKNKKKVGGSSKSSKASRPRDEPSEATSPADQLGSGFADLQISATNDETPEQYVVSYGTYPNNALSNEQQPPADPYSYPQMQPPSSRRRPQIESIKPLSYRYAAGPSNNSSEYPYSSSWYSTPAPPANPVQNELNAYQNTTNPIQEQRSSPSGQLPPIPLTPLTPICRCGSDLHRLCGVIISPKPDGKTKAKKSSSRKKESKHKSSSHSKSNHADVEGSSGSNCGPLILPGITPSPKPQKGDANYEKSIKKWKSNREEWKDITCPCGFGYFNDDGIWISGEKVRNGEEPPNPRWRSTSYKNPKEMGLSGEEGKRLYERVDPGKDHRSADGYDEHGNYEEGDYDDGDYDDGDYEEGDYDEGNYADDLEANGNNDGSYQQRGR